MVYRVSGLFNQIMVVICFCGFGLYLFDEMGFVVANFQGCFRQSITVVTIYASLGEEALIYSLNEVGRGSFVCVCFLLVNLVVGPLNLGILLLTDSSINLDMRFKTT